MDSQTLIFLLTSNRAQSRTQALETLYNRCYPAIKAYVVKNSGTTAEAEDIFQETVSIVYLNIINQRFRQESSVFTYTVAIGKKCWISELRRRKMLFVSADNTPDQPEEAEKRCNLSLIRQVMNRLNEGCRKILSDFYFEQQSMQEIAKNMGLGSTQAAKTKKLRCMQKLTKFVQDNGYTSEDFFE